MTWNYRIIKYLNKKGYGLHEVYYDNKKLPWGMTENPVGFACELSEKPKMILKMLKTACLDAEKAPVLQEPKTWPGRSW